MTTFVNRAGWRARDRESGTTSHVAHPSVTFHYVGGGWEYPWDHSSCDDKVRGIQADHMDNRGWSDIAYNYLVCPHDVVYEGRGFDRRSSANGNETGNNASFAICALWGSASADDPLPLGLKRAFLYARSLLINKGGATSVVKGHRDWKSTDCPGDQIYAWVRQGLPLPPIENVDNSMTATDANRVIDQVNAVSQHLQETIKQMNDDYGKVAAAFTDAELADNFQAVNDRLGRVEGSIEQVRQLIVDHFNKA